MKANIKAVISDMGDVLLRLQDPAPRQALAQRFGLTRQELEVLVFANPLFDQGMTGEVSGEEHWRWVATALGLNPDSAYDFENEFWVGDGVDEEMFAFIRSLRPKYKTAILSNAWTDTRQSIERRYDILKYFDVVLFSGEINLKKPDRRIYELALNRLGVEAHEALFFDDIEKNVEAAAQLGIHAIQVKNARQAIRDAQKYLGE